MQSSKVQSSDLEEVRSFQQIVQQQLQEIPGPQKNRLHDEFFDLGPLKQLVENPRVTEIIASDKEILFEVDGQMQQLDDEFLTEFTYNEICHKLFSEADIVTDFKKPFADGRWRDFRIHVIQQPIVKRNHIVTLRRNSGFTWSLDQLIQHQFLSSEQAQWLKSQVLKKKNILVVGPTGAGKTTLLNSLLQQLPLQDRVVIIEDTDELIEAHSMCHKLLARQTESESLPDIDLQTLLRQSLRMRPDRIVVGEVRGAEAKDMLLALSTGHSGFLGSLHAKSSRDALWRLEMLTQMGAPQWSLQTIRRLIHSSLHYVLVVDRKNGKRRVVEFTRLAGLEDHGFLLEDALV